MTANTLVVRHLASVALATALITAVGLAFGRHHEAPAASVPTAAQGAAVFARVGCNVCHTVDGTPRVGPSLAHRWGTTVVLADGSHITFDDGYVRESILAPQARAQPGYPPAMPVFAGILRERDIAALTLYLQSL